MMTVVAMLCFTTTLMIEFVTATVPATNITALHHLLARRPADPAGHAVLAACHHARGDLTAALRSQWRAARCQPLDGEIWCALASLLHGQGDTTTAATLYRLALILDPALAAAHYNLGAVWQDQDQPSEARQSYRRALMLEPGQVDVTVNLGQVRQVEGQWHAAALFYRRALTLQPDNAAALNGMASLTQMAGRLDQALVLFHRALVVAPEQAGIRLNNALALLQAGRYAEAWPAYEWRWRAPGFRSPRHSQSPWKGEALHGATILLHAEQGLGDTLQFIRYAPLVAARGGRVILQVQADLVGLSKRLPGITQVLSLGESPPPFDQHCPLMSLPLAFATTLDNIPTMFPYLVVDPADSRQWHRRLMPLPGLKVGLVWAGNPRRHSIEARAVDQRRSLPLAALLSLATISGITLISLQKGDAAAQVAQQREFQNMIMAGPELTDFDRTAALVDNLDLVISVDTSVAHLAGALGKPIWILSRFDGCWRWLIDRPDSPWYPTARLFRQTSPGDWEPVIAEVTTLLSTLAFNHKEQHR
ncbi:MAG: tetratricopeptide repeat-containing glycosyltransferase family protein [Acidobacteriaceae bacterium]|nr:tetratricopeptide repeat-containing glycosyltransferase family protein [Acidobacteriaceae bacterium]